MMQVPSPAQAKQSLANFYGAMGKPARSLPLKPELLFEPFPEYSLVVVAVDASSLDTADEQLGRVMPLRPCTRIDDLQLNETWIERPFEVVCHPMGGPKTVETALLRAVDSSTVWYIDALREGCHGGAVFIHDLWVGVHVQPNFKEVPRRCLRIDQLFREAAQFTDMFDHTADQPSRVMGMPTMGTSNLNHNNSNNNSNNDSSNALAMVRSAHHPDLTPLAAGTFVTTNRNPDALGISSVGIGGGPGRETHTAARAALRQSLAVRHRRTFIRLLVYAFHV